jgi:hypothetical protein
MKMRERLRSMSCWKDVDELQLEEIEALEDSEEDDEDESSDYNPEETDLKYAPLPMLNTLKDAKFDGRFPWTRIHQRFQLRKSTGNAIATIITDNSPVASTACRIGQNASQSPGFVGPSRL